MPEYDKVNVNSHDGFEVEAGLITLSQDWA